MDHRIALKKNTLLCLQTSKGESICCVIEKEIGRGGSCIVYEASRETETGDKTLYRVKEFYPYSLCVSRDDNRHLIPAVRDTNAFIQEQEQFRLDFSRTNRLFYSGTNYALMTNQLDIFEQNGTSYVLSAYSSQKTLASYDPISIKECIALTKSVAYIIANIHEQGFLYLDTKPDNVLIVDGLEKQIQLFDFNSLLSLDDLSDLSKLGKKVRISFTKGFAAIELQTSKIKRLGPHTDVFGIGSLLFYLLFGHTPSAPDCETDATYHFDQIKYDPDKCDDQLFNSLTAFFHKTLAVYYVDRYQSMQEACEHLNLIERYADITIPRIYSSKIARPKLFFGREHEFEQLDVLLRSSDYNCLFLTGMGGIGKSTLIREYLCRRTFDTMLYVHYKDSIETTISDDNAIEINTIRQEEAEKSNIRYFDRKLRKIKRLVQGTNSILVIDNFQDEVDKDLQDVLATDLKVILLSRQAPSYQSSQELNLAAISDPTPLKRLFEANLGRSITPDEQPYFEELISRVEGHTLILELIAKQIANSHITISSAASLAEQHGFSAIAPEKVAYEKDSRLYSDTIGNIIGALFEANMLSSEKKIVLKVLSLVGDCGIDINQFQQILTLTSKDEINELAKDGWLMVSGDTIFMHRVIHESVHRWEWSKEFIDIAGKFLAYFYVKIRVESTKNNYPKKLYDNDKLVSQILEKSYKDNLRGTWRKIALRNDQKLKEKLRKQGMIGMVMQERLACVDDQTPADIKKLAALLSQSEEILRQCKRESQMRETDVYMNLLYVTVLNTPRYREDYILKETSDIFARDETDFILKGTAELMNDCVSKNPATIIKLYKMAVLIHADSGRFEESEKLLAEAERLTKKVRHRMVYALYYDLLSDYYDIRLQGAYDTDDPSKEQWRSKLLQSIELTLRYSKRDISYDGDHLYVKNILAKATILMRSCEGNDKEVNELLSVAKNIIIKYTMPYADVRLQYYLVCAWYCALIKNSALATEEFVKEARVLSDAITPTKLQRIEEFIIPCANMFFELKCHGKVMSFLYEGIRLCHDHPNTDSYARVKQELCEHLLEVGLEAELFDVCRAFVELVDAENEEIVDPKNKIVVPDDVRSKIAKRTT